MAKYRVVINDSGDYSPQIKRWYFPFWINMVAWYGKTFRYKEDALDFIKQKVNPTYSSKEVDKILNS